MKRKVSIIVLLALILGLTPTNNVSAARKISISKKSLSLTVGKSKKLNLKNAKKSKVKWSSSKKSVATVSKNGKVTARKKGTAKITARYLGKKYNCKVIVKSKASGSSSVASTKQPATDQPTTKPTATPAGKLNLSSTNIDITQTVQLSLSGATAKSWSSSDDKIATVDNGLVTPLSVGSVRILCRDTSDFEYSCNITIGYPDITLRADSIYSNKISGTNYYGIDFVVTNNCDYDIKFGGKDAMTDSDKTVVFYYQYGFNQGVTSAFGLTESSPFNVGNQNLTITCQKGYETTIYAFEGKTRYVPSASSHFLWTITINGKKYSVVTDFYGKIVAMVLWGESDI